MHLSGNNQTRLAVLMFHLTILYEWFIFPKIICLAVSIWAQVREFKHLLMQYSEERSSRILSARCLAGSLVAIPHRCSVSSWLFRWPVCPVTTSRTRWSRSGTCLWSSRSDTTARASRLAPWPAAAAARSQRCWPSSQRPRPWRGGSTPATTATVSPAALLCCCHRRSGFSLVYLGQCGCTCWWFKGHVALWATFRSH